MNDTFPLLPPGRRRRHPRSGQAHNPDRGSDGKHDRTTHTRTLVKREKHGRGQLLPKLHRRVHEHKVDRWTLGLGRYRYLDLLIIIIVQSVKKVNGFCSLFAVLNFLTELIIIIKFQIFFLISRWKLIRRVVPSVFDYLPIIICNLKI